MQISTLDAVRCGIGEGALWDAAEQKFYVADVLAQQVIRYDPATELSERFDVGQIVGSIALRAGGGAIVGLATGLYLLDFDSGSTTLLADLEPDDRSLLLTEGKADPAGTFVVSSFALAMTDPVGSYYAVSAGGTAKTLRSGVVVPNGLAWSPDGTTIYFADSHKCAIYAADYDLETSSLRNERLFLDTSPYGGVPDGATVDAQGNYWVAMCQTGRVICFSPQGEYITEVVLPSKWVTSVAFGGPQLDRLFVTSLNPAMMNMGDDAEGGKLFVVDGLGTTGIPSARTTI